MKNNRDEIINANKDYIDGYITICNKYNEKEYNILNAKYERLAINLNNIIIEEKKKSNFIINELETQIKELKTPLYIRLIRGSYDSLFFIFLGVTFLYFFLTL